MSTYQRGNAINLVQNFWTIDPLTEAQTPADPTTVVFTITDPDGVSQPFTFGVDVNVTNPQVGAFVCALNPQLPVGSYRYRCDGTGAVEAASEGTFDVLESGVLPPAPPTVPVTGPCSSWINGEDVAAQGITGIGSEVWMLDDVAYAASSLLWSLTARQFPGVCETTVRPTGDACGCFGYSPAAGLGPWYWTSAWFGGSYSWFWSNECGDSRGCGYTSKIRLGGYPVREILEVKVDGNVIPQNDPDTGAPNWRLDDRRDLVRMWVPNGNNPTPQHWPVCQQIALDDNQPGTYSVKYTWGSDVPVLGRMAAAQLAKELWLAQTTGKCALPSRATKVVRQGVTVDRLVPLASLLRQGATGLQLVDAFIADVNPQGSKMRSAVWSPDQQQFARKVGQ